MTFTFIIFLITNVHLTSSKEHKIEKGFNIFIDFVAYR